MARAAEYVSCCAPSTGIAWEQPGLRFCKESWTGKCSEDKNTLFWRRARHTCARDRFSWAVADENRQRKHYEGHDSTGSDICLVGGGWESRVSRSLDLDLAYLMLRHLQKISSVLGAGEEAWRLPWSNVQHHAQRSKLDEWETTREIRNDSWSHQSRCACVHVSVCCTNKQIFHALGWDSFIVLVLKSVCGSHYLEAEKKTAHQFPDQLFLYRRWEKVANKNWKSKLLSEEQITSV